MDINAESSKMAEWEIQEIVAIGFLICLGLLLVTGVAGAIAGSSGGGNLGQIPWQQILVHATEWAGIFAGFVLIAVMGLIWWQVDGWTDRLSELDEAEDTDEEVDQLEIYQAVTHLSHSRSICAWLLVSCVVIAVATVALSIGEVSEFSGEGQTSILAQQAFLTGGQSLATLLLASIAIFGTLRSRRTCNKALSTANMSDPAPAS